MHLSDNAKYAIGTMLIGGGGFAMTLQTVAGIYERALWPYLPAAAAGLFIFIVGVWIGFQPIRQQNKATQE